ncbi:MAG TPA: beta-propeller fold lactonase family protein [Terriglobales bacterium]|nr:beta-propeller fold lactonase family protein [Terriglobales bacterium]
MSKKLSGWLAFLGLTVLFVSCGSSSSRPAGELYVLSQGDNNVGYFAIDLSNGRLSLLNKTTKAGAAPSQILLDPTGKAAYVLNTASNDISTYTVNGDGTLSDPPTNVPVPVTGAVSMARDAGGTFVIVVSQGTIATQACQAHSGLGCAEPPAITVYTTTSGSSNLTLVGSQVLNFTPTSVVTSITGTFNDLNTPPNPVSGTLVQLTGNKDLVGTNDNTVSEFVVTSAGAVIGPLKGSPYTTQSSPSSVLSITTTPTGGAGGTFVYVTNVTTNNLDIYQICTSVNGSSCSSDDIADAKMVHLAGAVSVDLNPVAMAVDPTNNFLYVVNHDSSTVRAFRINQGTGVLSGLNPATVSTGLTPVAISMHSTGKFLFVSNNAGSSVSAFNVDTTSGALSNATNVTSAAQPAGLAAR